MVFGVNVSVIDVVWCVREVLWMWIIDFDVWCVVSDVNVLLFMGWMLNLMVVVECASLRVYVLWWMFEFWVWMMCMVMVVLIGV